MVFERYLRKPSLPGGHKNSLLHISLKDLKFSKFRFLYKFIFVIMQGRSLIFQHEWPIGPSPFSEYVIISLPLSTLNFPVKYGSLSISSTLTHWSTYLCCHLECYKCYIFLISLDIISSYYFVKLPYFSLTFSFPSEFLN